MKVTKLCNNCNTSFETRQAYINRGHGKFCSRKCSGLYLAARRESLPLNVECSYCGKEFHRGLGSIKQSKSGLLYCSRDCQNLGVRSGQYSSGPKAAEPKKTCSKCGGVRYGVSEICGPCATAGRLESWLAGDNSVTLNISKTTSLPVATKGFVKRYLIKTRGDKCESCGFDQKAPNGRSIIQMDHIDGNCFNNDQTNLRLLCPNCHAMTPTYGSLNSGSGRAHRRKNG